MTTTQLIAILQEIEKGASGRSREIKIWRCIDGEFEKVLDENEFLIVNGTGDGIAGAEVSLNVCDVNNLDVGDIIQLNYAENDEPTIIETIEYNPPHINYNSEEILLINGLIWQKNAIKIIKKSAIKSSPNWEPIRKSNWKNNK